ncbi:hypothetical protein [Clostridium fessum]|uniref:hypothetical protein n=1 Tax=Clostridium fessum TaxID=2126740 RepID=UPI003AEF6960
MAKFTDYTEKTEPVDTDLALIYDTPAKVNKKFTFGNLWKWIAKKIVSEGISQLETTNKTIPGAINELNSSKFLTYSTDKTSQVILPVNGGGATVMIAYTLGQNGYDGGNTIMALIRYSYDGTKCSINYIYNYGNTVIENSISNNKNTITFKNENMNPLKYLLVKTFNIVL